MRHLATTQETPKAATAQLAYLDLGPDRSFAKLSKLLYGDTVKTTSKIRQLSAWSAQYGWVARAEAHDLTQREADRAAQAQSDEAQRKHRMERETQRDTAREKMDDERAELMRAAWRTALAKIDKRLKDDETRGLVGLVSLLKHAMDEERQARGLEPMKQRIELSGQMSVQHEHTFQDDPEAAAIARTLLRRLGSRSGTSDPSGIGMVGE